MNGTITQTPGSGALVPGACAPGATAGELDGWMFFAVAGRLMSIQVNPGTTVSPAPVSPQLL